MPKKVALLIGVSQYGEGLSPLSAAPNDIAALKRVLEHPEMAGFDQVDTLINPGLVEMQQTIQKLYSQCMKDDLVLLYFSGHGITDDNNHLYFASHLTRKDDFEATAVPARFIQQRSMQCYARRQVIILDCCYSGAFKEGWQAKAAGLDLQRELGAEGRVVLTSSTATQTSFQQEETGLSIYTQYLVEGIETGAADTNRDGNIFVHELHDYAKAKVQAAKPIMKPEILLDKEGFNILLSKASRGDRTLEFRQLVEQYARQGEISRFGQDILRQKQQEWGLTYEVAANTINSVLEPFRRRSANLERFRAALQEEVEKRFPLDVHLEADLRDWQRQVLGLADEDVADIWQQITSKEAGDDAARLQQQTEKTHQQEAENLKQQEAENLKGQEATRQTELGSPQLQTIEFEVATIRVKTETQSAGFLGLGSKEVKTYSIDRSRQSANYYTEDLGNQISLEMVAIPGGSFQMGSTEPSSEQPVHQVNIAPFFLGKYPVTQAQWKAIATLPKINRDLNLDPSNFRGDDRPVEQVSWFEAVEFCDRLSRKTGRTYRLPSEAEWEYACRAGTKTPFHFGETITTDLANYDGGSTYGSGPKGKYRQQTTNVGSFPANAFGLFDMHGNVWEWCADHWHGNYQGAPIDGSAWVDKNAAEDAARLLRGGSWFYSPVDCRSAYRAGDFPDYRDYSIGFRVVSASA